MSPSRLIAALIPTAFLMAIPVSAAAQPAVHTSEMLSTATAKQCEVGHGKVVKVNNVPKCKGGKLNGMDVRG